MALIHWWPLVPSLNGGDVTLDIVGGLSTANIGSMTQTEINGIQCVADASKRLTCTKTFGNVFTDTYWARYFSLPTGQPDDVLGCSTAGPVGLLYYGSGYGYFALDALSKGYADITAGQKSRLFDGQWHLIVHRLVSGTLTGYIDELSSTKTGCSTPTNTAISMGGAGGYGSIAQLKDHRYYDHALTADEIATMVSSGPNPASNPQYSYSI